MNALLIVVIVLGLLAAFVGSLMMIIAAFRRSALWGVAYLFVPFAALVFLIKYWQESKAGFVISTIGAVLACGALSSMPTARELFQQMNSLPFAMEAAAEQKRDLTAQIEGKRENISKLQGELAQAMASVSQQFKALGARRAALKPNDSEAIALFNEDAAVYQRQNLQMKTTQLALTTANHELSELLAARSREQAIAAAVPGAGKKIVMYTTPTCGACKVAKGYMAKKGVQYQEVDLSRSQEAQAEFARLGGRGVPLILVGDQRMEGFNPRAFDAML